MRDAAEGGPGPEVKESGGAVLLKVKALPGASRDRVAGTHHGALKIAVTAPPEKGKANEALRRVLARALAIRPSQVRLEAGASSREKWFRLEGLTVEEVRERLAALLAP